MNYNRLCMGCMHELDEEEKFCHKCGYKIGSHNSSRGLQPQTILYGKYLVGKVIGEGGFGITYIAYDLFLNTRVAIKEYFPSELVTRDTSMGVHTFLTVLTGSKEDQFKRGIERFVREAENLARFNDLPGIVSVKEFFYENNTAYMVMEYIDGITMSKYLEELGGRFSYSQTINMMLPLMNSLERIHGAGIVHRDISPDNIMVTNSGGIKLIDFGAARIVDGENVKSLTVILKHGYAPEEQYQPNGHQGPWTDVYSLAATMYRMITGVVPQEATDRILSGDKVQTVNSLVKDVPKYISDAVMQGLSVNASKRTRDIRNFRDELLNNTKSKKTYWWVGGGLIVAIIIMLILLIMPWDSTVESVADYDKSEDVIDDISTNETDKEVLGIDVHDKVDVGSDEIVINDEVRIELTEEEKLAQHLEFRNAVLDTIGVECNEDEYIDHFEDFDGDGDYELFMAIGPVIPKVFYVDDSGVFVEDYWGTGGFVEANSDMDCIVRLRDFILRWPEAGVGTAVDYSFYMSKFGRQLICYYSIYYQGQNYFCYTVSNNNPQIYEERLEEVEGIVFLTNIDYVKCFTSFGEELHTGSFFNYFSPYFVDGNFGILNSCLIEKNQYSYVDGLNDQINIYAETMYNVSSLGRYSFNGYVEGGGTNPYDTYIVDDVEIDSVFYNEYGYFVLNYKLYCSFNGFQHDYSNDNSIRPYYVSMAMNDMTGTIDYTGKEEDMDIDTVIGLYAHVILKFDGSTYSEVDKNNGYIGFGDPDLVLAESVCPWVD